MFRTTWRAMLAVPPASVGLSAVATPATIGRAGVTSRPAHLNKTRASRRTLAHGLLAAAIGVTTMTVGTGTAQAASPPALSWTPSTGSASFDYATIDAGQTGVQTFTLRNSGGSATSALTVTRTGSNAFPITSDTCSGTSLGPRKTCTVTVQYAPTAAGQTDTATLTATWNRPAARASLTLNGASTAPAIVENPYYRHAFTGAFGSDCSVGVDVTGLLPNTAYVFRVVRDDGVSFNQTHTTNSSGAFTLLAEAPRGTSLTVQAFRDGAPVGSPSDTFIARC